MKKLLIPLCVLALAVGCNKSPQEKQKELYSDYVEAIDQFKFDKAAEAGKQLAELEPNSPLPLYASGLAFERRLWYHDALGIYMSLNRSHPSFADAHAGAWRMFRELGLPLEEMAAAEEYHKLLPEDMTASLILAQAMIDSDLPGRAHTYLDTAVTLGLDKAMAAMIRARAFIADDKPNEADSAYEQGLAGAGSSPGVFAEAAAYLEAAGLVDSAVAVSRKAVALFKYDFDQVLRHFRLALRHNYFYEADEALRRCRTDNVNPGVVSLLEAFRMEAAGNITLAREAIDRSTIETGPTFASRVYESEIKIKASDELVLMNNYQYLTTVLVRDKYDPAFQELMFYLLGVQAGRWMPGTMGMPFLNEVGARYQNRADLKMLQILALQESGQSEAFAQEADNVLKYHARQVDWIAGLAGVFANRACAQYDRAAELYARSLEMDHWNREVFVGWIAMHRRLGQYDRIAGLFDTYSYFAERHADLAMLEGICLVEAGQAERGVEVYCMNAPMNRGDEGRHRELYDALAARSLTSEMGRFADFLKEQGGRNPRLLALAATMRLDAGDNNAGLALAEEALALEPDLLDAKALKARAFYGLGRTDEALALLEENLKTDQYHVPSNHWVSRILATEGRDPNRAQDLARRAVFDSRHALPEWVNLTYVYRMTGRPDLARGEALKMSRAHAGEPLPLYCIGMALYTENKTAEAKERLQEAVDKGLTGAPLTEAREILAKLRS